MWQVHSRIENIIELCSCIRKHNSLSLWTVMCPKTKKILKKNIEIVVVVTTIYVPSSVVSYLSDALQCHVLVKKLNVK